MRLDFIDGSHIVENKKQDTFFVGFNHYLFLRDSCYKCKYTGVDRISDFTIADFWGVDLKRISDQQRKYGVSLILVNSEKGRSLLSELEKEMHIEKIDPNEAIPHNQALVKPGKINNKREKFFKKLGKVDFDRLVHRYNWKLYTKISIRNFLGDRTYDYLKNKLLRRRAK